MTTLSKVIFSLNKCPYYKLRSSCPRLSHLSTNLQGGSHRQREESALPGVSIGHLSELVVPVRSSVERFLL